MDVDCHGAFGMIDGITYVQAPSKGGGGLDLLCFHPLGTFVSFLKTVYSSIIDTLSQIFPLFLVGLLQTRSSISSL